MYQMTPWVTRLLIANIGIYFVLSGLPAQMGNSIANALVFRPGSVLQTPWTPVTYMFLHAGFGHLFGNMIGIFFFGPRLEQRLGAKGFLTLYFAAGIGGAFFESLLALFLGPVAMVGASGGVFGILAGFAYFWPRETIILFPIPIPIQAWLLVTLYVMWSLYAGLSSAAIGGGVAHFAHLGGAVVALGGRQDGDLARAAAARPGHLPVDLGHHPAHAARRARGAGLSLRCGRALRAAAQPAAQRSSGASRARRDSGRRPRG